MLSKLFFFAVGLLLLNLIVLVHELGHFAFARLFSVHVESLSLGMGPCLFSIGKHETKLRFCLIPFGGSTKMAGNDDIYSAIRRNRKNIECCEDGSLYAVTPVRRALTYAGGPIFNLLSAVLVFSLLFIRREQPLHDAVEFSASLIKDFISSVLDLLTGKGSIRDTFSSMFDISSEMGSITFASFANQGFLQGLKTVLFLSGILDISLAMANLLPITALDGGMIIISLIEAIRKKLFPAKAYVAFEYAGLAVIVIALPILLIISA